MSPSLLQYNELQPIPPTKPKCASASDESSETSSHYRDTSHNERNRVNIALHTALHNRPSTTFQARQVVRATATLSSQAPVSAVARPQSRPSVCGTPRMRGCGNGRLRWHRSRSCSAESPGSASCCCACSQCPERSTPAGQHSRRQCLQVTSLLVHVPRSNVPQVRAAIVGGLELPPG